MKLKVSAFLIAVLQLCVFFSACGPDQSPPDSDVYYTVHFDVNVPDGVTVSNIPDSKRVKKDEAVSKPSPNPSRSGFTFIDWYTAPEKSGEPYDFDTPVTVNNFMLYAHWEAAVVKHTVTFDYNGRGTNSSVQAEHNTAVTLPQVSDLPDAFFGGWHIDTGCTTPFIETNPITGNTVLYAKWTTAYSVGFDLNGGSSAAIPSQKIAAGGTVTQPANPAREGDYTFAGWFKTLSDATAYDFDAAVDASFMLYAKWNPTKATVRFDLNGAAGSIADQRVDIGGRASVPPAPVHDGAYVFGGWFRNAEATGDPYNFTVSPVNADITLYAKWLEAVTLSFDLNGGTSAAIPPQKIAKNAAPMLRPSPNPTRDGYLFVRWCTDQAGENEYNFTTPLTQDTTLYAKWASAEAPKFTVSFDLNGGAGSIPVQEVTDGAAAQEPPNPAHSDMQKIFAGWYTEQACVNAYDFDTPVTGALTLYAKWAAAVTVGFDLNGGTSAAIPSQRLAEGARAVEPSSNPARDNGYVFDGWYTEPACVNVYNFDSAVNTDLTLYAKWSPTSATRFTVGFDLNGQSGNIPDQQIYNGSVASRPLPNPVHSDPQYRFAGWYTEQACENLYQFGTPVAGNLTLYAKWALSFKVSFHYNYPGAPNANVVDVSIGGTLNKPADPIRLGDYEFLGWSTAADGVPGDAESLFGQAVTEDTAIYAQWLNRYVYEAEHVDLSKFYGSGYSGYITETGAIVDEDATRPLVKDPDTGLWSVEEGWDENAGTASGGQYLAFLTSHDTQVLEGFPGYTSTLTFTVHSDRAVTGAKLSWRLSMEFFNITIFSGDEAPADASVYNGKYTVTVNGAAVPYGKVDLFGVPDSSDQTDYKRGFEDFVLGNVDLVKGENVIKLITDNTNLLAGTMYATAPMVDCIKLETYADLTWVKHNYYPED